MYESVQISKRIKKTARMKKNCLKRYAGSVWTCRKHTFKYEQRAHAAEQ